MCQKVSDLIRTLFATVLLCTCALTGCSNNFGEAQKCTLTVEQAPEVGTFRLGTSLDDLRRRFPELQLPAPDIFSTTTITLKSSSDSSVGGKSESASASSKNDFTVNTEKHPEFREMEEVELGFFEERLFHIQIHYPNKPEWQTYEVFANDMARKLKLPVGFEKHDRVEKMSHLNCVRGDGTGLSINAGFKEHGGSEHPYASLLDFARFVAFSNNVDRVKASLNRGETPGAKSSPFGIGISTPQNVTQVEIAGVSVRVGQDAYIPQDRLESHLVKTEGNTDTYSYAGVTYQITYSPGEMGAYFVKSIRVLQ